MGLIEEIVALLIVTSMGLAALVGFVVVGLYAATWVIVVLGLVATFMCWRLIVNREHELTAWIIGWYLVIVVIALIVRYPTNAALVGHFFLRTVTR